ncbi:MAG: hydroxyacid dehydrogenase [Acidobacteriales bacterium 59-55]|nr:2-hydroxyacid dehydrogenase [Terriglobales bacterium]ODU55235.1 MAG: hydroxyacid dehydrogenase [Granulicella sp. SCN 62-9]OJV39814.1 MAG: hydroxyacid dehydrogenase [Acidobacteriales bacterium 59-55]
MVRVGVDESLSDELLIDFPREAKIVRIPRKPTESVEVDFWILPFQRRDAADAFSHLRGVKVVQSMMAGVDWITPWLPKDIVLCDGRGIHDISASEWVLGAILSSLKRFPFYRDMQLRGEWKGQASVPDGFLNEGGAQVGQYRVLGEDLAGKTVLIVGYGSIGAAIEARLAPFGVKIDRVARSARSTPEVHSVNHLQRLLPDADVVVLIVPLTAETRGLMGATEIELMKRGALLVNAARGPVVVTDALVEALEQRRIRAVLDVTDPEPLPEGHPLWAAPNCLITPHVGGSTPEFIHRAFQFGVEQVRRFIAGEKLENIVTDAGY